MIATASPRSAAAVRAGGTDHIVDPTTTPLTDAVAEPDDVVLNLVRAPDEVMAA